MAVFLINEPKCVLIHIPKTGGTSIRNGFFDGNYEGPVQGYVPHEWQSYFAFCFVRNPFDRLVSAWKMFTHGMDNSNWKYPDDGDPKLSFKEFVDIVVDESIPFDGNRETFEEKIRHHTMPQTHPYHCIEHADFVGRFETLFADFKTVCERLGLNGELPHWNQTIPTDDYREFYDPDTLIIARRYYADDVSKFNYDFNSAATRVT